MTISGNLRTMPLHDVLQWIANGRLPEVDALLVLRGLIEAGYLELEIR